MTTVPLYHCTMLDMTVLDDDASLFWQCGRIQMPDADTLSIIFIIINNIFIIIIIISYNPIILLLLLLLLSLHYI